MRIVKNETPPDNTRKIPMAIKIFQRVFIYSISRLQKIILLLLTDRHFEFSHDFQHVFPDFAFLSSAVGTQEKRRMKRRHQRNAAIGLPSAAQFHNADRKS